ncbi:MAG: hypothetical protein ACI8Z0_000978, partial [Lentimonas sp.]
RVTQFAWLFWPAIYDVFALPSQATYTVSGTFLLCATRDISTWLQQY